MICNLTPTPVASDPCCSPNSYLSSQPLPSCILIPKPFLQTPVTALTLRLLDTSSAKSSKIKAP